MEIPTTVIWAPPSTPMNGQARPRLMSAPPSGSGSSATPGRQVTRLLPRARSATERTVTSLSLVCQCPGRKPLQDSVKIGRLSSGKPIDAQLLFWFCRDRQPYLGKTSITKPLPASRIERHKNHVTSARCSHTRLLFAERAALKICARQRRSDAPRWTAYSAAAIHSSAPTFIADAWRPQFPPLAQIWHRYVPMFLVSSRFFRNACYRIINDLTRMRTLARQAHSRLLRTAGGRRGADSPAMC
jgi:hypothetical protein